MGRSMDDVVAMAAEARNLGLSGQFDKGHALLDQAQTLAGTDPAFNARIAIERGRLFNSSGARDTALPLFELSWNLARETGKHDLAVDAAHMAAIAAPIDEAARWTLMALGYIAEHPRASSHWTGALYNNLGWHYFEARRYDEALATFEKGVEAYRPAGGRALRIAQYTIVRTLRALGRIEEAIVLGEDVVAQAHAKGDSAPYVYEELAECYAMQADARSRAYAEKALATLGANKAFIRDEPVRLGRLQHLAGIAG